MEQEEKVDYSQIFEGTSKRQAFEERRNLRKKKRNIWKEIYERRNLILRIAAVLAVVISIPFLVNSCSKANTKRAINKAQKVVTKSNDYEKAVKILEKRVDSDKSGETKQLWEEYFTVYARTIKEEAYQHTRNYDYRAAAETIEPLLEKNLNNFDPYLNQTYETYVNFSSVVEWTGDVEHVFFHSLIYDPEKTFVGDYQTEDFDDNYVTVTEFKRLLDRFYENNFILYDIKQLYTVNSDGTVSSKKVYVPEGKKPLVMSFDDTCYYDYMKPYGFVQGVDIGEDGAPRTYIWNNDGTKQYIEDGDFIPILESFINSHPDFTYGGTKGTIAFTGYEGILGYRTNEINSPDYDDNVQKARKVTERLSELGWNFASHSYGHRGFDERDAEWYAKDTDRWEKEVASIIGGTDIYIYPFGTTPDDWNDPKQVDFKNHGFKIFCGVYKKPLLQYKDDYVFMERRNIDGIAFRDGRLNDLMDMTGIVEVEARPQRGYQ